MTEIELPPFVRVNRKTADDTVGKAMLGWSRQLPLPRAILPRRVAGDLNEKEDELRSNQQCDEVNIMKIHGSNCSQDDLQEEESSTDNCESVNQTIVLKSNKTEFVEKDTNNSPSETEDQLVGVKLMKIEDSINNRRKSLDEIVSSQKTSRVRITPNSAPCSASHSVPLNLPSVKSVKIKCSERGKQSEICMHDLISHRYLAEYKRRLDNLQAVRKRELSEHYRKSKRISSVKENTTCRLRAARIGRNNVGVDNRPPQWRMPRFRGVASHLSTRNQQSIDKTMLNVSDH